MFGLILGVALPLARDVNVKEVTYSETEGCTQPSKWVQVVDPVTREVRYIVQSPCEVKQ